MRLSRCFTFRGRRMRKKFTKNNLCCLYIFRKSCCLVWTAPFCGGWREQIIVPHWMMLPTVVMHKSDAVYDHIFQTWVLTPDLWMRHKRKRWIRMCTCWSLTHPYLCESNISGGTFRKVKQVRVWKNNWTGMQVFIFCPQGQYFNWTFSLELLDFDRMCAGYQYSTCFPSGWLCNYPYNSYCIWSLALGNWAIMPSPQQQFQRQNFSTIL